MPRNSESPTQLASNWWSLCHSPAAVFDRLLWAVIPLLANESRKAHRSMTNTVYKHRSPKRDSALMDGWVGEFALVGTAKSDFYDLCWLSV